MSDLSKVKAGEVLSPDKWNTMVSSISELQNSRWKIQTGEARTFRGEKNDLYKGTGIRTFVTPPIKLSGFTSTPFIMYNILSLDVIKEFNMRINIQAIHIKKSSFKMQFTTWSDTKIYSCDVKWFAIGI